ncbi:triple tyrosine motif-containing protein [Bacillus toyonensis]|uniref:triple tyrosine motif-containing protein n=1 Tax=Bacillus toyonensis TaxID=155322 RepID=UPI00381BD4D2
MKSRLLSLGMLICLIVLAFSYEEVSAETTWGSKCASFGEIKPNQNPSFKHMNCLLTSAALDAKIPPEVVKAVAKQESSWRQFVNGQPLISQDGGIGLMQITNKPSYDQQKLKYDIEYNIQAGIEILNNMYSWGDLPKIKGAGPEIIENWYFPIMAYNGIKPINSPLKQSTGERNPIAYQENVFPIIEADNFWGGNKLGQFPFSTADFEYDPGSDKNIVFRKKEYTLTDPIHFSTYSFQKGDNVVVTGKEVNLRSKPNTSSSVVSVLAKGTNVTIDGDFLYDQSLADNPFVWYPVKTADQKLVGYISSAYVIKVKKAEKVNNVKVVTDKVGPQSIGTPITLTATSEGSNQPQYKFNVYDGNTWKVVQDYSDKSTYVWKPEKAGTYKFSVHAKDANSQTAYDSYYVFDYKVEGGKVSKVNVITDKEGPQSVGVPITLTATSEGSEKPQYKFNVYDGKSWKVVQDYSDKSTYVWKPEKAGTYKFSVHAKDANSQTAYDSYYAFDYKVEGGKVSKVSVITDKEGPQNVGVPITLTATSEGSEKPQYKFNVYDGKSWKVVQDYSDKGTYVWKPEKAGTYKFSVHAKDVNSQTAYDSYSAIEYKIQ